VAAEYEFESPAGVLARELKLELDLGASYQLTSWLALGLELRNDNIAPVGAGWLHSALFLGPVVAVRGERVWAALSVLPQLASLRGPSPDLDEHERVQARLLVGVHL
jgi:hypothetical protein